MKLQGGIRMNKGNTLNCSQPLFSIITVVFNGEKHLERTINSVISQDFPDYEYLIIDGASKDKTLDIIRKYDDRVSYWQSEPDKGLYDAMNKGLKAAQGDYVCFINVGDELCNPYVLKELAAICQNYDSVYSDSVVIDETGNEVGLLSKLSHNNAPDNLTWKKFSKGMVVCHQSFFSKRLTSPFFDLKYRYAADIDWMIRFLITNPKTIKYSGHIAKYMVGGVSQTNLNNGMKERYEVLKKHFGFFSNLINHLLMIPRVLKRWLFRRKKTNF